MTRNHTTIGIPPELIKIAGKCTVRECDETDPGRFEAFVDEGRDSWDVSVTVDKAGGYRQAVCECETPQPCRHVAALLQYIESGKALVVHTPMLKKAKAKKAPPYVSLLDDLDGEALKRWLHETLPHNKELQLAFVHYFSGCNRAYTPEEAKGITVDAAKTVLGRTRNPDATQIKKIVALWKDLHAPILERYLNGPADEAAFLPLQAALDVCIDFLIQHDDGGKISGYVDGQIAGLKAQLASLALDEAFECAARLFISNIIDPHKIRVHYLPLLIALSRECSPQRRLIFARLCGEHGNPYARKMQDRQFARYRLAMLNVIHDAGLFALYADIFGTLPNAGEYNLVLLREFVATGHLDKAADIAWKLFSRNGPTDFDVPYLNILREIYRATNNNAGLIRVANYAILLTWDYEDYKVLAASMPEEERAAFRKDLYTKSRYNKHKPGAGELAFALLEEQGDGEKMIGLITHVSSPYASILARLDMMVAANPKALLKELFYRQIDWVDEDETAPSLPMLAERLIAAYGTQKIKLALATLNPNGYRKPAAVKWLRKLVG